MGFDPGGQLQGIKRLHHIIVRPCSQSQYLIQIRGLGAEHDDGNIIGLPDLLAHLKSVHSRHHDIQKHQMDVLLCKDLQSLGSIFRLKHFIAIADKINFNQIRNLFFIIYNQDINIGHDIPSSYVNLYVCRAAPVLCRTVA